MWGATLGELGVADDAVISIHAPRVGSDVRETSAPSGVRNFNPRSPCGERHRLRLLVIGHADISIHAPRVGSDLDAADGVPRDLISIHAPRVGSDLDDMVGKTVSIEFQSTLPVWGATSVDW